MRVMLMSLAIVSLVPALAMAQAPPAPSAAELKVGDPAPPFSLPGTDGKTHSLADFAGKRAVVLAWFPKAFTGG
jgi:thioredoxin-dependent peroxiredoxin